MIDDIFIFDNVIHVYDMSDENLRTDESTTEQGRSQMVALGEATRWQGYDGIALDRALERPRTSTTWSSCRRRRTWRWRRWCRSSTGSRTASRRSQPSTRWRRSTPTASCSAAASTRSTRASTARWSSIDHQVQELGARSMKFYNGHIRDSWRCDDEKIAYPMYQRCLDNGIKTIQFHKGIPFGMQNVEDLAPERPPARGARLPRPQLHHPPPRAALLRGGAVDRRAASRTSTSRCRARSTTS